MYILSLSSLPVKSINMSVEAEKTIATPTTTTSANNVTSNNNSENEHLLQYKWVLWFRPPTSGSQQHKSWQESHTVRFTTETVEDFWRGYRKTQRITKSHTVHCDYSLFREGIGPAWEDPFNSNGGRWTYTVDRRHSDSNISMPELIETKWLDVMLCLIGEGFDPHGSSIGGGVCGIRPPRNRADYLAAKIHIWTKDASDQEANMAIGKVLQECLQAVPGSLSFTPHSTQKEGGKRGDFRYNL